ncbi:MAG: thioredoxin [Theionarchaea archaeon]|nr:thioredoxin [Theionarchaea archaeon]
MDEHEQIRQKKMEELKRQQTMPSSSITITDADFEGTLKKFDMVVVDFWATWCMPCKMIEPTLEALAKKLQGEVVFARLNVDENPRTSAQFQVMSIPTLIVFKKGAPVKRIVGAVPQQYMEQQIMEAR